MRYPGPIRASDARRSPCRTNREHRDGCGAFPGAPCAATSPSADEGSRLSPRPRFCSPFSLETEGRITARCHLGEMVDRPVASVFVITREHHLASRSILAGSTTPSARCDASPFVLRAAQGVLRPIRRPAPIRWFVASFRCARVCEQRPGWCAEHLVVAPAWSPVRRYRRPARQRVSPGPSQRLRALSPLSRARGKLAPPFGKVASSHEDPFGHAAPRRIDTAKRIRGAVRCAPSLARGPSP
jgi:hypothetical protein